MATTLTKDPVSGAYIVKEGDSLSKIAQTQGRTLAELLATNPQFSKNPNLIHPGDVVNFGNQTQPSYGNLTGNTSTTSGTSAGYSLPQNNTPTTTFTAALIKMLKDAQARDATGQAGLMKQSQGITGLGLNDATRNFSNPLLTPSAGTSLGRSATDEFEPLTLSVANQQKLGTQNLNNITDLVKQTQDAYDKEQERLQRAEEKRLDRLASAAKAKANFDTDSSIREYTAKFKKIKGLDNYVDPNEWIAAREAWGLKGGSDASFESNFKKYLNPASYSLAGYKAESTGISAKQQALIDALKKK